jgi:ribonuclease I
MGYATDARYIILIKGILRYYYIVYDEDTPFGGNLPAAGGRFGKTAWREHERRCWWLEQQQEQMQTACPIYICSSHSLLAGRVLLWGVEMHFGISWVEWVCCYRFRKHFGIHGYWPSYDQADISCVLKGADPYCKCDSGDCQFDYTIARERDLASDLDHYWPEYGIRNAGEFRKNEWNKHGVCYMKLMREKYPGQYSDDDIFRHYLAGSVEKTKKHGNVSKYCFANKEELRKELNLDSVNTFYLACTSRNYIQELRICYDLAAPGQEKQVNCFQKDLDD